MRSIGLELRFCDRSKPWAGWHSKGGSRPLFVISTPYNGQPHHPGNGQMTAFLAESRALVRAVYQMALASAGTSDGEPGLRPDYHAHYYAAYFRDSDGNKFCIVCHNAED